MMKLNLRPRESVSEEKRETVRSPMTHTRRSVPVLRFPKLIVGECSKQMRTFKTFRPDVGCGSTPVGANEHYRDQCRGFHTPQGGN